MSDSPTPGCSHSADSQDLIANLHEESNLPESTPSAEDPNLFTDYDLLTSSEYLQEISPYTTKLVEIVGIVHLVKGAEPVTLKNGTVSTVCAFYIHNNDGETVQCIMWGDTIDQFIDKLLVQHVVHIDGAFPKTVSDQFNSGTTPYELIIQSNTIVTDLGKIKLPSVSQSNKAIEVVPLIKIATQRKIVVVKGFVKTPWAVIKKYNDTTNTCYGSIAADKYFLDVKISDFPNNFTCEFTKGQHVQCLGSVIRTGNSFFFCVQGPACITLVDSQMATLKDLLICKPLLKLKEVVGANANSSKKLKRNEVYNKKFPKKD